MRLAEVSRFEFGDAYILFANGRLEHFDDLDTLLELMGDMFRLEAHAYVPSVEVHSRGIGIGPYRRDALRQVLWVVPVKQRLPASDDWIEGIRKRVTHYNLSGSWDYFETENL